MPEPPKRLKAPAVVGIEKLLSTVIVLVFYGAISAILLITVPLLFKDSWFIALSFTLNVTSSGIALLSTTHLRESIPSVMLHLFGVIAITSSAVLATVKYTTNFAIFDNMVIILRWYGLVCLFLPAYNIGKCCLKDAVNGNQV